MMAKRRGVWLGRAAIVVLIVLPVLASAFNPLQAGRASTWVFGTLAGVLALSLLALQLLLPTGWLRRVVGGRDLRWHRLLGLAVAALVLAHVVGLYLYSPDDIGDALVLQAPTYSRLGVLSAWCLALSIALALARRRIGLAYSDWQILHAALAVAVVGTGVGHVLLLEGTLDGPAEWLTCAAVVLAVSAAVVQLYVVRPLQRKRAAHPLTPPRTK